MLQRGREVGHPELGGGAHHQHVLLWPTSICTFCLIHSPQLLSTAGEGGQSLFSERLQNTELAGQELLYSRLALSQDGSLRHVIYIFYFQHMAEQWNRTVLSQRSRHVQNMQRLRSLANA